ncbi:Hpt domain-containing protein [Novipirellula artificiosorum]|uniref:Hpt domain protein n=1 Tax=Novipirellula artificiosorum TaxID=2528016 RepID=A0A5C6E1C1_9BACT|nr:Hpt domain-containing protein [Novipirellula artificiosorum]TWU41777.1 Hpt domain protein [Novipirellula artificiosorum]
MTSTTTTNSSIIDYDELIDRMMGSAAMASRMLKRFVETARVDCDDLESTVRLGDKSTLSSLAHRHKGTARTMAMPRVAEVAAELERRAHSDSTSELLGLVDELRQLHGEVSRIEEIGLSNLPCNQGREE